MWMIRKSHSMFTLRLKKMTISKVSFVFEEKCMDNMNPEMIWIRSIILSKKPAFQL
jgi:hypothetical protein